MGKPTDLVQGTLDLLILKTLSLQAAHGWAIAKRIEQMSSEVLQVQQGWISSEWTDSDTGRRAKVYSLTRAGRTHYTRELESWERLSEAVNLVVRTV